MKTENLKVYAIRYKEDQPLDEGYIEYFNKPNKVDGYLFEYKVIIDILDNHIIEEPYLAILSWRFPFKTGTFSKKLHWMMSKNPGYDVYVLCRPLPHDYMKFSEEKHPGLTELLKKVCEGIGVPFSKRVTWCVYSNFFAARTEIYKDYVETYIKPAIALLKGDLWELANKDSGYGKTSKLKPEELEAQIGMRYYNMVTFVLERLFSQYLQNKKLKVKLLI